MVELTVVIIDVAAILTVMWIVRLVRHNQLYVGYGVIFVVAFALGAVALTFPFLLKPLESFAGTFARSALLIGLVLAFVVLLLIYILSQLTVLSHRLTTLVQALAVRDALSSRTHERSRTAPPDQTDKR